MTPASTQPVVAVQSLVKTFKDFWLRARAKAVDEVSFEIRPGEVFGLLGPNGSGKSTTIKILLGLLRQTRGRVAVFGKPPSDVSVKKRIGYLPEESYLYPFLNARETLEYYGKLFGLDRAIRHRRMDELLDMVGLTGVQHRQVREYSKGMQRRIGIAQALINDPELLILDEPTTGLDPIGTRQIKDLILELGRRGKTVLLSSHLLSDVEDCVDRMVILYGGKIRAEGTCDSLLTSQDKSVLEFDALDEGTISEIDRVVRQRTHGQISISRVSKPRQRLEDLFVDIVEQARAEKAATSGAQHGGQTAAFLRGSDGPAQQGEALIDSLLAAPPPQAPPQAPPLAAAAPGSPVEKPGAAASTARVAAAPSSAKGQDEMVLASLLASGKGESELLTIDDAAKSLGTNGAGVRDLAAAGRLHEVRDKGRTMFRADEVQALAAALKQAHSRPAASAGSPAATRPTPPTPSTPPAPQTPTTGEVDLSLIGSLIDPSAASKPSQSSAQANPARPNSGESPRERKP